MISVGSWVELVVPVVTGAGSFPAFEPCRWRVVDGARLTVKLADHLGNVLWVERTAVIEMPEKKTQPEVRW